MCNIHSIIDYVKDSERKRTPHLVPFEKVDPYIRKVNVYVYEIGYFHYLMLDYLHINAKGLHLPKFLF